MSIAPGNLWGWREVSVERTFGRAVVVLAGLACAQCGGEAPADVYDFANGCFTVALRGQALGRAGHGFAFGSDRTPFTFRAADLGIYLLYDPDGGYLVVEEDGALQRQTTLESDVSRLDDAFVSGAEWALEADGERWHLRNRRTSGLLGGGDPLTIEAATGCAEHPELTLDAAGAVTRTRFEDGDLYGIVDAHTHLMSNWGFGGGGLFHGAPFHRLGVAHALPDCAPNHGEMGRADFIGYAFDGADGPDLASVVPSLIAGGLQEDNHATAGWPLFSEWPDAPNRSTHQTQYYKWLERAWLAGLRLIVQHATTNTVLCELTVGTGAQVARYSCDDMVAVDREIDEVYAMERYIDAQSGGPGEGWFRVVRSPAEARAVIEDGKMAVILGIETSDPFECRLVPASGGPVCDEAYVSAQLDAYYERGIRAIFPVHKYDNAFSPGDGDRGFIELGNFLHTGHWSNFVTEDCPPIPSVFDEGDVMFGGLNAPRDEFLAPPPYDLSGLLEDPVAVALPFLGAMTEPPLVGEYCQKATLTPLGERLIDELMARGMIVEIDHLPRRSYLRALELLDANDYPAVGSHGETNDGHIYVHGGISKTHIGQCRDPETPGALLGSLEAHLAQIEAAGGYPAEGLGFDLNGFAGARGPRFAEGACASPQEDPVTYPFPAYAGDVTFTAPRLGDRAVDFNQQGMVHIGLLPELLQDARADAASDADLEPLFRSAEAYLRMWEKAESRRR